MILESAQLVGGSQTESRSSKMQLIMYFGKVCLQK